MPLGRLSGKTFLVLLAVLGTLALTTAAAVRLHQETSRDTLAAGDVAVLDIVIRDADGTPIFATDAAQAQRLHDETGSRTLVDPFHPAFGLVNVTVGTPPLAPGDLTRLFTHELAGHRAGDGFDTTVKTKPFGDWARGPVMPRTVGPFPLQPTVSRELFEESFPNHTVGQVIQLTAQVPADAVITSIGEESVSYRNLLAEGDAVLIERLGIPATVLVDEEAGTFSLRFDPPVGYEFTVRGKCGPPFYDLETGSYRVTGIDDGQVTLDHNANPYPSLVGRDLYASVTVHAIEKPASLPAILSRLVSG